jgi:serine/threonine protein phosphatase PrpC
MPHEQPLPVANAEAEADLPDAPTPSGSDGVTASAGSAPIAAAAGDTEPQLAVEPASDTTSAPDAETAPAIESGPDAGVSADLEPSAETGAGGDLDELVLPSAIRAPEPLSPGTEIGPDGRLRVVEHLGTRGRVNLYAATRRQDDGQEIEVELREAAVDHAGLLRESEILTGVRYGMLPCAHLVAEQGDRRYLAVDRLGGESLEAALTVGLPPERAISIFLQLVQATRRLHQAGWALLGLTPADVTMSQPVRIAHLEQAGRIGEPPAQALSVAGYSAPELAYRETITGKEDVYTLGAILYRALTGHPLSEGADAEDLSGAIRLPGGPQLLADVLTTADDRLDLEALYQRLLDLKARQAEVAVSLEIASATTLGLNPTRLVNEDSSCYAVWARTGAESVGETALLCVADGMGGMEAGEVASQTAVDVVMRTAVETLWPAPRDGHAVPETTLAGAEAAQSIVRGMQGWPTSDATPSTEHAPPPRIDPAALVRRAATAVHAAGQGRNLGTTITCVAVHDGELTLGHVGDTRAYLLRDGALTRLTADHSLVAAMVASGVITAEEAEGHPDSNKVLRSLGSQRELPPAYVDGLEAAYGAPSLRLTVGDILMLCSDGVWGTVHDRDIQVALTEALDAQNAARALVDRALQGGAPDNATAIVARCVRRPVH